MKKGTILLGILVLLIFIGINSVTATTNVSACGYLNSENEVYELNITLNSSYDCLIINATNITLDCKEYTINYGNALGGFGVKVFNATNSEGFDNIIIRNCVLVQNQTGFNDSAIFFAENSQQPSVYNNNISTSGNKTKGIFFQTGCVGANATSNMITSSGDDSSAIVFGDNSTDSFASYNIITLTGNRNLNSAIAGIFLETGNDNITITSNNITTSGINVSGIWALGANITISNNVLTSTGQTGDGIYLNDVEGITISSNTINTAGNIGYGIHSYLSGTAVLVFDNNVITTSGNNAYAISVNQDSNNNITSNNITTSGTSSYGIYLLQSDNTTIINNRITTLDSSSYVMYFNTSADGLIYNNVFNTSTSGSGVSIVTDSVNYFNTTNSTSTNIISRDYFGGNFWTNSNSNGYSDICVNIDDDYFCDSAYNLIASDNNNADYLPLTNRNGWILSCGTLNVENKTYYLNQSILANGTCFNIAAEGVILNLNGYNITGNTSGYGININGYNGSTILNGSIYDFSKGIYLANSQNNNVTNLTMNANSDGVYVNSSLANLFNDININNSNQNAIVLEGISAVNNSFTNVVVANTNLSYYDLKFATAGINGTWIIDTTINNYTFTGVGGLVNFKTTNLVSLEFLTSINGSGTNLTTREINLASNSVFINSSINSGLNKTAKITFYGITYTDPKPQYSVAGTTFTDCTVSTNPICNEVSFSGTTFIFNVSHFTYFRSAEAYTAPVEEDDTTTSSNNNVIYPPTYRPNANQLDVGYDKLIYKNSKIVFDLDSDTHIFKLVGIDETTTNITISSDTQEATLTVGKIEKFELSGDDYYDLSVKLNSIKTISSVLKANFTITSIHEAIVIPEESEPEPLDNDTGEPEEIEELETLDNNSGEPEELENLGNEINKKGTNFLFWTAIILIVILLLFLLFYKKLKKSMIPNTSKTPKMSKTSKVPKTKTPKVSKVPKS